MTEFILPSDKDHLGLLLKFQKLKGTVIKGKEYIKGKEGKGLPADGYVSFTHRLHDQIRGIYKPKEFEFMLSCQVTESEDNYGKQIVWDGGNKDKLKEIILRPPNGEKDNRKISDIRAADLAMNKKMPVGILQNIDKGENKIWGLGIIDYKDEYGFYHIKPIDIDINKVEREFKMNNINYFTFRTNDKEFVNNQFLNDEIKELEFTNIPNYYDETKNGDIVLVVLGGDKPNWNLGLRGICRVVEEPYDRGYDTQKSKYFKLKVKKELVFDDSISRTLMVPYLNLYNMIFIGPMLKGEPNQLNVKATEVQIISVVRAILDYYPKYESKLIEIFGQDIIDKAKLVVDILEKKNSDENIIEIEKITELDIDIITDYINNKGFIYEKQDLINFYLSLKTKPFVILAGVSGTGKSKLVKLFAEAINAEYKMISVKPDWNDNTELLGYKNIKDDFVPGELYRIIEEATREENKDKPYLLCLDEMNLARVEYYLSDYLSIIESREFEKGSIITKNLFSDSYFDKTEYKNIIIPENLYIIGTVNMDDTTFSFSRKVLDRANTIEFSTVNLSKLVKRPSRKAVPKVDMKNMYLKSSYITLQDAVEMDYDFVDEVNKKIIEIYEILEPYAKQFGYRVRDEIVFYMLENKQANLLTIEEAFDYQLMQKILPTIIGSDLWLKDILLDIYRICIGYNKEKEIDLDKERASKLEKAKYPKSAKKILNMLRGYDDGFVSYWQ